MEKTSAEMLEHHIAGRLLAAEGGYASQELLVQIFARKPVQDSFTVPAVAEPLLVCILTGSATIEERPPGGNWAASEVGIGDFFVTDSDEPYELRWQSHSGEPFEVMHLYLGLPMLERAAAALFGIVERPALREVSGGRDPALTHLFAALAHELTAPHPSSALMVNNLAQAIAIHLVRDYRDLARRTVHRRSALGGKKLSPLTIRKAAVPASFGRTVFIWWSADVAAWTAFHTGSCWPQASIQSRDTSLSADRNRAVAACRYDRNSPRRIWSR